MFRSDRLLPLKASTIPLVLKNALSRIATSTEMIDRILKLYPKRTRHPTLLPKFSSQRQMFRFDPTQTPALRIAILTERSPGIQASTRAYSRSHLGGQRLTNRK